MATTQITIEIDPKSKTNELTFDIKGDFEKGLLDHLAANHDEMLLTIRTSGEISEEINKELHKAITALYKKWGIQFKKLKLKKQKHSD